MGMSVSGSRTDGRVPRWDKLLVMGTMERDVAASAMMGSSVMFAHCCRSLGGLPRFFLGLGESFLAVDISVDSLVAVSTGSLERVDSLKRFA